MGLGSGEKSSGQTVSESQVSLENHGLVSMVHILDTMVVDNGAGGQKGSLDLSTIQDQNSLKSPNNL